MTPYSEKSGRRLFLHCKQVKKPPKEKPEDPSGIPEKVSKMAIGVEGGFKSDVKKEEFEDFFKIVVLPDFQEFAVDDQEVPLAVQMSAKAVIQAQSAIHKAEIEAAAGTEFFSAFWIFKFISFWAPFDYFCYALNLIYRSIFVSFEFNFDQFWYVLNSIFIFLVLFEYNFGQFWCGLNLILINFGTFQIQFWHILVSNMD